MNGGVAPSGPVLIGIDIGMSFLKVAVFDQQGRLVAAGSRPYQRQRPAPDRIEEDPEQWLEKSGELVREFLGAGAFRVDQVAGISLSARGSGATFVDRAGRVLTPHWLDGRHGPQSRQLIERFGPYADNRALASKTLHLAETAPDLFAQLGHPLFVKDFVLYRLTGEVATDPSSGPRNIDGTADPYAWPAEVWAAIGFPLERVPVVRPHTAIGGHLLPAMAELFGLPAGLPVGIGGHDGACANAGAGAIQPGQVCLTMGTNGVARSIAAEPAPTVPWRGISAYHFLPGRWCCGGDMSLLGHAPTWLAGLIDAGHEQLEAAARAVAPGTGGVTFLPYLRGQICPTAQPARRAAFLGLDETIGHPQLYRAALEGTASLIRLVHDRLGEYGLGQGEWRVSGGGAKNRLWLEIIAALINRPLYIVEPEEGPRGACMFLAVGLGWFESVDACAAAWLRTVQIVEPSPPLVETYQPIHERFARLDQALAAVEGR